jgi:hypothetical protein
MWLFVGEIRGKGAVRWRSWKLQIGQQAPVTAVGHPHMLKPMFRIDGGIVCNDGRSCRGVVPLVAVTKFWCVQQSQDACRSLFAGTVDAFSAYDGERHVIYHWYYRTRSPASLVHHLKPQ